MSKLYFYKFAHFLLFLSLTTVIMHQLHSYMKILTLIPLILTPSFPYSHHSHLDSPHSSHSHPDSHHSHPDSLHSLHSHPDSSHSHHSNPDSPHSPDFHPDSPHSHPDSPCSHHSHHSVPQFPIPAFTDSLTKLLILVVIQGSN